MVPDRKKGLSVSCGSSAVYSLPSNVPICGPVAVGLTPFHEGQAMGEEPLFLGLTRPSWVLPSVLLTLFWLVSYSEV